MVFLLLATITVIATVMKLMIIINNIAASPGSGTARCLLPRCWVCTLEAEKVDEPQKGEFRECPCYDVVWVYAGLGS